MLSRKALAFFILLLIIVAIPRVIRLFSSQSYFGYEQADEIFLAKRIVVDRELILIGTNAGGVGGFSKGPWWNYLMAVPFLIFNGDPFGQKILMFSISLLTVVVSFIFIRRKFDTRTAVFVSFFLSFSPYLLYQAGQIWPPFGTPLLIVLFLYSFFNFLEKKGKYLLWSSLIVGLMNSFEPAICGVLFFQLFFVASIFLIKRLISFKYFIISILVFISTFLPIIFYDLSHNFSNAKGIIKIAQVSITGKVNSSPLSSERIYLENKLETFTWNFRSNFTPHRMVSVVLFLLIYLGAFYYIKNKSNPIHYRWFATFLAISPFFTFIVLFFYPGKIFGWWLINLTVFYCFLVGIIAGYFSRRPLIAPIVWLLFLALLKAAFYNTYLLYRDEFLFSTTKAITKIRPIEYIYKDANTRPFNIKIFSFYEGQAKSDYEYLIWWLGTTRYNNLPKKQATKLTYILIENNNEAKFKYNNEQKMLKGSVLEEKVIDNNYIVQKRIN